MSHNTHTLLTVAAELRTAGASWDAVARKVHRKPKTCQKWPSRFRQQWDQLYRSAQQRRFEETSNEAHTLLKHLMRSDDDKLRLRSIEIWLRNGAAAYGLHGNLLQPVIPANGSPNDSLLAQMGQYMEQDRQRIDKRRALHGLPPANDDEFVQEWDREINEERNHQPIPVFFDEAGTAINAP